MQHRIQFFFFNDTATTEIYTLSLHDALPISQVERDGVNHIPDSDTDCEAGAGLLFDHLCARALGPREQKEDRRSEEHTSELQSRLHLVCRLLLEKKKKLNKYLTHIKFATIRV